MTPERLVLLGQANLGRELRIHPSKLSEGVIPLPNRNG
jgi:hypothetical protein